MHSNSSSTARLPLSHYFGMEALSSFNSTIFLYCIFFWTRARFGFSDDTNLLITATHGLFYIFAARFGGKLADRVGYDKVLFWTALFMGLVLALGWLPRWIGTPFVVIACYTLFIAPSWPALEAAVVHSPSMISMPHRLGFYNITWAGGDALGLALGGFLFRWNPDAILWVPGIIHLLQAVWMKLAQPGQVPAGTLSHSTHRGTHLSQKVKKRFMLTSWLGNGLAYVMIAGFFSLAPELSDRLHWSPENTIWLNNTFFIARTLSFVLFWKWHGWHYHDGWSITALITAPLALLFAFFISQAWVVFIALFVFGISVGLSYNGSIYYSMDYGENKGEFGGWHECILGIGLLVGPLLAVCVSKLGGGTLGAQWTIIGIVFLLTIIGTTLNRHAKRLS